MTRSSLPTSRDLLPVLGFGVVGVGLFYASYQLAVDTGGATLAAVLLYTAPAWVAFMGTLWLAEQITPWKLLAIVLTIAGVAQIAFGAGGTVEFSAPAIGWGLLSGWCYALYYPFGRHYFHRYTPASIYALALPAGALILWPAVDFSGKSLLAWTAIAGVGLASTYLAYLAYGQALRRLEATRASILATLEPVVAGLVAFAWWGEQFGLLGYLGAVLVLCGVLIAIYDRRIARPARQESGSK